MSQLLENQAYWLANRLIAGGYSTARFFGRMWSQYPDALQQSLASLRSWTLQARSAAQALNRGAGNALLLGQIPINPHLTIAPFRFTVELSWTDDDGSRQTRRFNLDSASNLNADQIHEQAVAEFRGFAGLRTGRRERYTEDLPEFDEEIAVKVLLVQRVIT